jgi:hypothetical protein
MTTRSLDAASGFKLGGNSESQASAMRRKPGLDHAALADLSAMVEQALELADASGFGLVGIDLCSALERLQNLGEAPCEVDQRDCE